MAGDLPGAELEPKTSFLMAPQDGSLLIPQPGGWSILIPAPFRALPPVSWRSCLALPLWKGLKEILEVGPAGRARGWGWGWEFGAGGRPGQACPEGRIPCTHALDAGMSTEL